MLIDTSYAARGPSGTGTYLRELVAALPGAGVDVVTAADVGRPPPGGGGWRSAANVARDAAWLHLELERRARSTKADVVHHALPAHSTRIAAPQVVTVHDVAFLARPDLFDPRWARLAATAHRRAALASSAVVVPSEATRRELLHAWPLSAGRVVLAPHGAHVEPVPEGRGEHLLYVGDDEPRKDLGTLLRAHRALGPRAPRLVLAGAPRRRHEDPNTDWVVRPSRDRLRDLQTRALALVHPAVHEGFGLTVLEAMAAGVPVVAAASDAVAEVTDGAALLVPPGDPHALTDALRTVLEDADLRARLRTHGLERAAQLTWAASARAHAAAYSGARAA